MTGNPHIFGEPVKSALLESFAVANAQCSCSWEEVADRIPDIMTRHVPVDQTQTFLTPLYISFYAPNTRRSRPWWPLRLVLWSCLGMYSWGAQASLTRSFTQVIPGSWIPGAYNASKPLFQRLAHATASRKSEDARAVSADTTVYTPIPPPGSVNVPMSEFLSRTTQGSANLPICMLVATRLTPVSHP